MPASYPGAVKTFATRTAGQAIDPSHVNDLQDEVAAIEAGLLNGTAPVNSSRASVIGLQVTGNSTLGSTITISPATYIFPSSGGSTGEFLTCVSTSGSTMHLQWRTIYGLPAVPFVTVTHSAGQAIASDSNAFTGLNWDTEDDAFGMHSTTTNSSRVTFTAIAGRYLIGATLTFDKKSAVERQVILRMNDSSRVAGAGAISLLSLNQSLTVSALVNATSTADYFTVMVSCADGGSTVVAHSTGAVTRAWAKLVL